MLQFHLHRHGLQPFFPGLAPQDFYRYKTIHQLIDRFGAVRAVEAAGRESFSKNGVVVAGMSCRFPSSVETVPQFWEMLLRREDQVKLAADRGRTEAGYLDDAVTRFDHRYFDIPPAEARTMDPQQILALELTEMLWQDAGIDPETLDKNRVGVYLGVWNWPKHVPAPEKWAKLGLALDRKTFVATLVKVRDIRNEVMHFNPDPMKDEDLWTIRDFASFLRRLQSMGVT